MVVSSVLDFQSPRFLDLGHLPWGSRLLASGPFRSRRENLFSPSADLLIDYDRSRFGMIRSFGTLGLDLPPFVQDQVSATHFRPLFTYEISECAIFDCSSLDYHVV